MKFIRSIFSLLTAWAIFVSPVQAQVAWPGMPPWFTPGIAFFGPSGPTIYVSQTFTGTPGTSLTSTTTDQGGSWTLQPGWTGTSPIFDSAGTGIYSASFPVAWYASPISPTANGYVECGLHVYSSVVGDAVGPAIRVSSSSQVLYIAWAIPNSSTVRLVKSMGGVNTTITNVTETISVGSSHVLRIGAVGTTISVVWDGATIISTTDSSISAAGNAGIYSNIGQTALTGAHLTYISAAWQ